VEEYLIGILTASPGGVGTVAGLGPAFGNRAW